MLRAAGKRNVPALAKADEAPKSFFNVGVSKRSAQETSAIFPVVYYGAKIGVSADGSGNPRCCAFCGRDTDRRPLHYEPGYDIEC